jgi:ABC-2 type transport system ATP-binding protein
MSAPEPPAPAALELSCVSKAFGETKAVDRLDLAVPAGTVYGLLGPNGAGKSTTIRMSLNIFVPDEGSVLIDGAPISSAVLNRIGYLPEERGLYTKMKVRDLLAYLAAIKGVAAAEARPRIGRWLDRVDLAEWGDRKVQDLSKGMQQKVQFIATVLHEPDLIILDEPFSGLDPINTELLKDIIMDLHGQGRTIIFSTHIMEQAERLCDAICLISGGRKVLDGSVASIKSRYGSDIVALAFDGDGSILEGHRLVGGVRDQKTHLEVRLAEGADPQALLADLIGRVRLTRFELVEPSLHDIFIERVQAAARDGLGRVA